MRSALESAALDLVFGAKRVAATQAVDKVGERGADCAGAGSGEEPSRYREHEGGVAQRLQTRADPIL